LTPVNFLTGDILNAAFIPQYTQLREQQQDSAQTLFWTLAAMFGGIALLLPALLWWAAGRWVGVLAPGVDTQTQELAITMLRIMAVGIPFYLWSALLAFLAMAHKDFGPMALRPVVQNLGMIAGAVLAVVLDSVWFLAWGFTVSYVLLSGWATWRARRAGFLLFPDLWSWPEAGEVMRAFWRTLRPLVMLPFMLQGNIVVERAVASLVGLAAVSALDYARFVSETLILLLSVPVAFAGLAHWSGLSGEAIRKRLETVLRLLMAVSVPISAFLAVHAHTVVQAAYGRGAFDDESVRVTGDILQGTAVGLWAQVVGYVLLKALNAQMRNSAVLWVMGIALLANIAVNLGLHHQLGAMTLGLGSSAYGLILLGGCLTALGLWKQVLPVAATMAIGCAGFMLLSHWLPTADNVWRQLSIACTAALFYWGLWVFLVPSLRKLLMDQIPKSWRTKF
jgi:putative peptidoglycan lipid II flippase